VLQDVNQGYVSAESALRHYGVQLSQTEDGAYMIDKEN
jgi:hypothetical protein